MTLLIEYPFLFISQMALIRVWNQLVIFFTSVNVQYFILSKIHNIQTLFMCHFLSLKGETNITCESMYIIASISNWSFPFFKKKNYKLIPLCDILE